MGFALSDMIIQRWMKNVKYILQISHGGVNHNAYMMHIRKRKMQTVPLKEEFVSDADTPESALLKDERDRGAF